MRLQFQAELFIDLFRRVLWGEASRPLQVEIPFALQVRFVEDSDCIDQLGQESGEGVHGHVPACKTDVGVGWIGWRHVSAAGIARAIGCLHLRLLVYRQRVPRQRFGLLANHEFEAVSQQRLKHRPD